MTRPTMTKEMAFRFQFRQRTPIGKKKTPTKLTKDKRDSRNRVFSFDNVQQNQVNNYLRAKSPISPPMRLKAGM